MVPFCRYVVQNCTKQNILKPSEFSGCTFDTQHDKTEKDNDKIRVRNKIKYAFVWP